MAKKEYYRLEKIVGDFLSREHIKKLSKIDDYHERTEGLKYLLASKIKMLLLEWKSLIVGVDKKESFIVESKLCRLEPKLKMFFATHHRDDFLILEKLIKEIEVELAYVRSVQEKK